MSYIQGGLRKPHCWYDRGQVIDEIRRDPFNVRFYSTTVVGSAWSGRISDLPARLTITIWGPDPVHDRQWRVTVKRSRRGFEVT